MYCMLDNELFPFLLTHLVLLLEVEFQAKSSTLNVIFSERFVRYNYVKHHYCKDINVVTLFFSFIGI